MKRWWAVTAYVIIPGIDGSDDKHWQTLWEREWGASAVRISPASWSAPDLDDWVGAVQDAYDAASRQDGRVVLVAHSLGCWAASTWLISDPSRQVGGAFLVAPRAKGETVDEIVGFRDAILAAARPLPIDPMALDIVGTGGDRFGTVNVSSMSSIVCAAAGVPVAKHGNRAASSASGSSDTLAALGAVVHMLRRRGLGMSTTGF